MSTEQALRVPEDHEPTLSEEVAEVQSHHPGWHVWLSREQGMVLATTTRCAEGGTGTTLDAPNPQRMEHEIALWEHQHGQAAA